MSARKKDPKGGRVVLVKKPLVAHNEPKFDGIPKILKPDAPILSQEFVNQNHERPVLVTSISETNGTEPKTLNKAIDFITPTCHISGIVQDYLQDTNTFFRVIGVIGATGVGKTTLMNMLGDTKGKTKIFPSGDDEQGLEAAQIFITKDRHLLIDTRPLSNNKYNSGKTAASGEIEELKLLMLLLRVCHTILVVQDDSNINLGLLRSIRFTELLDFCLDKAGVDPKFVPNVLFVQNRMKNAKLNAKLLTKLMEGSKLNVQLGNDDHVNVIHVRENPTATDIELFRRAVFQTPRLTMSVHTPFTELVWFQMVQQLWKLHNSNYFLISYEKMNNVSINND